MVKAMRLAACGLAAAVTAILAANSPSAAAEPHWVGSWAASQQAPEPADAVPPDDLRQATLRQVVRLSLGGARLRVRISNAFGTAPLRFVKVHAARALQGGAIAAGTDQSVSFGGAASVVVPAGAEFWSDPVELPMPAGGDLAVSLVFDQPPDGETEHPGSRATSYLVHGDHAGNAVLLQPSTLQHWLQLSGVDAEARSDSFSVVTLGDSITDGHGATTDGNDRWPDDLARRLAAAGRRVGVLNAGLGGNRVLADGLGPGALARLDRDILAQSGVGVVILLEGINDLGVLTRDGPATAEAHAAMVQALLQGYAQVIALAHAHRLRILGATLLPDGGSGYYHPGPASEADRQALNAWIRTPGRFDGVIDFDRVMRDPRHPDRLAPAYDSGDHLHPSPAGYRVMAEAVPLDRLQPPGR